MTYDITLRVTDAETGELDDVYDFTLDIDGDIEEGTHWFFTALFTALHTEVGDFEEYFGENMDMEISDWRKMN